jgi:phosphate starvation-inducible PhoH-like protein
LNELKLSIENINPAVLWGSNNDHFEIIKKQYPKLKIVARGSDVKVLGEDHELNIFKDRFQHLLNHVEKFDSLNITDLERILGSKVQDQQTGDVPADNKSTTGEVIVFGPNGILVKARTANQRRMVDTINRNDILFAIGPAGTGKTYTAVALAVRALKNKEIKRIILTRPAVEAGENLGFLPGDLKEKIDPYLRPLYDALDDMIPAEKLDNCFVILDEAQNATDMQLKMFLTRMGPSAKFIVTGDVTQIDLPKKQQSGLHTALRILTDIKGIDIIYLTGEDVVRHKLVRKILEAYGDIQ